MDLKSEYYDLGLPERDRTDDQVTVDAANACKKYGVGVKCATITPNVQRMSEYHLKKMWKSPNGTIRSMLDGTVFRAPDHYRQYQAGGKKPGKPITIARHAYGDVYKAVDIRTEEPGKVELVFTGKSGKVMKETIQEMDGPGVLQGCTIRMHRFVPLRTLASVMQSAQNRMSGLAQRIRLQNSTTASFKQIFTEVFEEYKADFERPGYYLLFTPLIDDAVARVIRSEGGYIWACKKL